MSLIILPGIISNDFITSKYSTDYEIKVWCPTGSVLPNKGEGASLVLVGFSAVMVLMKMLYWIDVYLSLPVLQGGRLNLKYYKVQTDLGRWVLVVLANSLDLYSLC